MPYQWDQRTETITDNIFLGKTLVSEAQVSLGNGTQSNTNVGYTGHQWDDDSSLNYMQARYYNPLIGRFLSYDPIGFRDVHSFNRYTYANNYPYKFIDPTGQVSEFSYLTRPMGVSVSENVAATSDGASMAISAIDTGSNFFDSIKDPIKQSVKKLIKSRSKNAGKGGVVSHVIRQY